MGRWDDLDPSRDEHRTSKKGQRNLRDRAPSASNAELLDRYRQLVKLCDGNLEERLISLASFVKANANNLPPEENTKAVVNNVFLHFLETRFSVTVADAEPPQRSAIYQAIFACLASLLQNAKHRTSLLAPLTDRVLESGDEHRTANPVRSRLFKLLQKYLAEEPSSVSCFVVALQAAKSTDGGNAKIDPNLDLWYIQDHFRIWETEERERHDDLVLLETLVAYQPSVSVALCKLLLLRKHRSTPTKCSSCGLSIQGATKLLKTVHGNGSCRTSAMRCITGMLRNLPLGQWISQNRARNISSGHSWTFRDKVVCLIEDLLLLLRYINREDNSYADLVVAVLSCTPFQDDENLCRLAKDLVASLSGTHSFHAILTRCFGGRVAPSGALTQTPVPVKDWLLENKWCAQEALTSIADSKEFLCGLFRSEPSVVLNDYAMWAAFKQAVSGLQEVDRAKAAQVIDSLLSGREYIAHVDGAVPSTQFREFVLQILDSFYSGSTQLQLAACSALAHFLERDWEEIESPDLYMRQVLRLSLNKRSSQKVKVEGYRATGTICSRLLRCQCLSFENSSSSGTILFDAVMLAVLQSDAKPQIRGMALFAAGCLLQSIQHRFVTLARMDSSCLIELQSLLTQGIKSEEEKVGVNALRSSGIFCTLLLSNSFGGQRSELKTLKFVDSVFIECSICLAAATPPKRLGLTWKQRTAIKKKARAACRCLEMIFSTISPVDSDGLRLCRDPLSTLIGMIREIPRFDEKLVVSVLSTLHSFNLRNLTSIVSNETMRGPLVDGLAAGARIVLTESLLSMRSIPLQDFEKTLLHLLAACTEQIVSDLLDELGREPSEKFLVWLTKRVEVDQQVLSRFANICSSHCVDVEIQLLLTNKVGALAGDFHEEL